MRFNSNGNIKCGCRIDKDYAENKIMRRSEIGQLMDIKEVARYLGVHEITMYRLIRETDIPTLKLRGQWRFKKDLLDAWIAKGMHKRGERQKRR